jgi:hypothetical protein
VIIFVNVCVFPAIIDRKFTGNSMSKAIFGAAGHSTSILDQSSFRVSFETR